MSAATITPAWMGLEDAAKWSGLSTRTLERLIKGKLIVSSNCRLPGNKSGKRLVETASLDTFIRASVGAAATKLPMHRAKAGKEKP